jgi:hypothetical protein
LAASRPRQSQAEQQVRQQQQAAEAKEPLAAIAGEQRLVEVVRSLENSGGGVVVVAGPLTQHVAFTVDAHAARMVVRVGEKQVVAVRRSFAGHDVGQLFLRAGCRESGRGRCERRRHQRAIGAAQQCIVDLAVEHEQHAGKRLQQPQDAEGQPQVFVRGAEDRAHAGLRAAGGRSLLQSISTQTAGHTLVAGSIAVVGGPISSSTKLEVVGGPDPRAGVAKLVIPAVFNSEAGKAGIQCFLLLVIPAKAGIQLLALYPFLKCKAFVSPCGRAGYFLA